MPPLGDVSSDHHGEPLTFFRRGVRVNCRGFVSGVRKSDLPDLSFPGRLRDGDPERHGQGAVEIPRELAVLNIEAWAKVAE